jgi:hypothetical protein
MKFIIFILLISSSYGLLINCNRTNYRNKIKYSKNIVIDKDYDNNIEIIDLDNVENYTNFKNASIGYWMRDRFIYY